MLNNPRQNLFQRICSLLFIVFLPLLISAQGAYLSESSPSSKILERMEILNPVSITFHSSIKPFNKESVIRSAVNVMAKDSMMSELNKNDLQIVFNDNNEWLFLTDSALSQQAIYSEQSKYFIRSNKPVLKYLYGTPGNAYEINKKGFHIAANPILDLGYAYSNNVDDKVFMNSRGLEIRGGIDDKVYFYTNVVESQARFPDYVNRYINKYKAVPGAGLYKPYVSEVFNISSGQDFLTAQAHLSFNFTQHIGMQFGHGRNFIGNGYRSFLLSDFSNNYFYAKLNWKVWNLHLQNIFAELNTSSEGSLNGDQLVPKKYMAAHYLDYKVLPNLSFGLFEAVMFSRENQFELQYLNPVILYRTVEHSIGSPDNILLGLNAKLNFLKQFQLYGQLFLDEFKFDELILQNNGEGWWANKYAIQLGAKYINVAGIDHLDAQVEYNMARPYTFTHRDSSASYSHYNQALGHPLGANFKEYVFHLKYQPFKKWRFDARYINALYGADDQKSNWGQNILLPYTTREQEYNNEIGQGIETKTNLIRLNLAYQIFQNCTVELEYLKRNETNDINELKTSYFGINLRLNALKRENLF